MYVKAIYKDWEVFVHLWDRVTYVDSLDLYIRQCAPGMVAQLPDKDNPVHVDILLLVKIWLSSFRDTMELSDFMEKAQ